MIEENYEIKLQLEKVVKQWGKRALTALGKKNRYQNIYDFCF